LFQGTALSMVLSSLDYCLCIIAVPSLDALATRKLNKLTKYSSFL
jgi:hypothetical protein